MGNNLLSDWERSRKLLVVRRVLQAGLEFNLESIPKIVKELSYSVQREKNQGDCVCYESEQCHPSVKNLNCFLCSCPNYDSTKKDTVGFTGACRVSSSKGNYYPVPNPGKNGLGKVVLDCSSCTAYHSPSVVERYLRKHLREYAALAEIEK